VGSISQTQFSLQEKAIEIIWDKPRVNFMSDKSGVKIPPGGISSYLKNFSLAFLLEDRFIPTLHELYSKL
jgi:hypothetical protein